MKSPHFQRPTLFLFDRVQGGVGLSSLLLEAFPVLVRTALGVVQRCACREGCPACVGPRAQVGPEGKETVLRLLEHLHSHGRFGEIPVGESPTAVTLLGAGTEEGADLQGPDFGAEGHFARGVMSEDSSGS